MELLIENFTDTLVLIVAAGRGSRMGEGAPKQYRALAGRPVLAHTIDRFFEALPGAAIQVVIHPDDRSDYDRTLDYLAPSIATKIRAPVLGGDTRQASVRNGLEACVDANKDVVLIHDAARPFTSVALIREAHGAALEHGCAAPGSPVVDTVKIIDDANFVLSTPDRARLRAVQTPQAFRFSTILNAHRAIAEAQLTDDCAIAERAKLSVYLFPGDPTNMKITTSDDLAAAEAKLFEELADIRVGNGFDVHGFEDGDAVWLGGVAIPHDKKLEGHSDADVLMHAITDAILGAIAQGDIGDHFPPSEPKWKGAPSSIFLKHAVQLVHERGGRIAHIDANIVAERPKIGPHRDAIRAKLAEIIGVSIDRIGLKATTAERLGFVGREEGIVAMAVATVRLPLNRKPYNHRVKD